MSYLEQEYNQFLRYVKSTFGQLFENDWKEEPKIEKIIFSKDKNSFDVFVYLNKDAVYYDYDFQKRELLEIEYTGRPIKTHFDLQDDLILYMLLRCDIIKDLALEDVKLLLFDYIDGIEENKYLSKMILDIQEDYAYDLYCMEHDL